MLGMKSNRSPIKGEFADKLREQITINPDGTSGRKSSSTNQVKVLNFSINGLRHIFARLCYLVRRP